MFLMKDFFEPLFNKERDERRSVRFLKVSTIIVGLLPVVIAIGANNVLHIAYLGKGLRAALAVLVLLAFYAPSFSNGSGAFIGIIVTLPATVVWYMLGDPYGIDNAYVALACPVIVMGLFHLTSRRTAPLVTGNGTFPHTKGVKWKHG